MKTFLLSWIAAALVAIQCAHAAAGTWTWSTYVENDDLYLRCSFDGVPRYDYRLGGGGCIVEMNDCLTGTNLIAPTHIGNSTDRVIQWTFWSYGIEAPQYECDHPTRRFNMNQAGNRADVAAETMYVDVYGDKVDVWCRQRDQWQPCYDDNLDGTITWLVRYEMAAGGVLKIRKVVRLGSLWKQYEGMHTVYDTHFEAWIPMRHSPQTFNAMAMEIDSGGNPVEFYTHGNFPPNTEQRRLAESETLGYSIVYRNGAHATNHSVAFIFGDNETEKHSVSGAGNHRFNSMSFLHGMALIPFIDLDDTPTGTMLDIETWILPRPHLTSNTAIWLDVLVPQIPAPKAYGPTHVLTGELKDLRDELVSLTGQTGSKTHQLAPLIR